MVNYNHVHLLLSRSAVISTWNVSGQLTRTQCRCWPFFCCCWYNALPGKFPCTSYPIRCFLSAVLGSLILWPLVQFSHNCSSKGRKVTTPCFFFSFKRSIVTLLTYEVTAAWSHQFLLSPASKVKLRIRNTAVMNTLSASYLASPRVTLDMTKHLDRALEWKIV